MKLIQWRVELATGKVGAMFTPVNCDEFTAAAIAIETFGVGVTAIVNEGKVSVDIFAKALSDMNVSAVSHE